MESKIDQLAGRVTAINVKIGAGVVSEDEKSVLELEKKDLCIEIGKLLASSNKPEKVAEIKEKCEKSGLGETFTIDAIADGVKFNKKT